MLKLKSKKSWKNCEGSRGIAPYVNPMWVYVSEKVNLKKENKIK